MTNEVSPEALRASFARESAAVFATFITIDHDSLDAPVRIVDQPKAIERSDGTFQPYPFACTLPEQKDGQIPQAQITIDNIDLDINHQLRNISGAPSITVQTALTTSPDTAEQGPYYFSLQSMTGDMFTLSGTLGYEDDIWAQQVPGSTYNPSNSPGMFL